MAFGAYQNSKQDDFHMEPDKYFANTIRFITVVIHAHS